MNSLITTDAIPNILMRTWIKNVIIARTCKTILKETLMNFESHKKNIV